MKNSWIKNSPICYKGIYDNITIVENTMPAINTAVELGYNLYLNLSLTKDNQLIVFDNKKSSILLASCKKVDSVVVDEEDSLKLINTEATAPLLTELLRIIDGKVGIVFKIDNNKNYKRIVTLLIKQLALYKGDTAIVAPTYKIYFFIKRLNKDITCGLNLRKNSSKYLYNALLFANTKFIKLARPDFIICDISDLNNRHLDDYLQSNPYSYIISHTVTDKESYLESGRILKG